MIRYLIVVGLIAWALVAVSKSDAVKSWQAEQRTALGCHVALAGGNEDDMIQRCQQGER